MFHADKSDAHERMQNMLCGLGGALQARLDTKLILLSRLSPWRRMFQWKAADLIVSAYAFITSLHDKYTLVWWLCHAWYCLSDTVPPFPFPFTRLDFIIQFGVNPIMIIYRKLPMDLLELRTPELPLERGNSSLLAEVSTV